MNLDKQLILQDIEMNAKKKGITVTDETEQSIHVQYMH